MLEPIEKAAGPYCFDEADPSAVNFEARSVPAGPYTGKKMNNDAGLGLLPSPVLRERGRGRGYLKLCSDYLQNTLQLV